MRTTNHITRETSSHWNSGPFSEADLPMSSEGRIYHLNVTRDQLSSKILLVGDPDRVPMIADQVLEVTEHDELHRGLRTITGRIRTSGMRVSIVTSGMGPPSLEIVVNELMALNEIDPHTRCRRDCFEPLDIIRVGTSGILQSDIALGTPVISSYAVGLDNTGLFYNQSYDDDQSRIIEAHVRQAITQTMDPASRFYGTIHPYVSKADPVIVEALRAAAKSLEISYVEGITVSSGGFFANQGRDIGRIPPTCRDIDACLANLDLGSSAPRFINMEMESSQLFHFARGHGYRAGTICAGVANRRSDTFAKHPAQGVADAIRIAIRALEIIDSIAEER